MDVSANDSPPCETVKIIQIQNVYNFHVCNIHRCWRVIKFACMMMMMMMTMMIMTTTMNERNLQEFPNIQTVCQLRQYMYITSLYIFFSYYRLRKKELFPSFLPSRSVSRKLIKIKKVKKKRSC